MKKILFLLIPILTFSQTDSIEFYHPKKPIRLLKINSEKNYIIKLDSLENKYKVKINSYIFKTNGDVLKCRRKDIKELFI